MTYNEYKAEVEQKYGKAVFATPETEANQSAKMLLDFKAKQMQAKVKARKAAVELVVNEKADKVVDVELPESKVLDRDLKGFDSIEKDILRAYFANRDLKPGQLAQQFGRSYQYVAGLLKSNKVQLLVNKYFAEDLSEHTKLSLLKLVKTQDPRATLAAAEYLGVMSKQGSEDSEFKADELEADQFTQECLQRLADWLVDVEQSSLTLVKPAPKP